MQVKKIYIKLVFINFEGTRRTLNPQLKWLKYGWVADPCVNPFSVKFADTETHEIERRDIG